MKKKHPFHSSNDAVGCYNSSDRDSPCCFDTFKRLVESAKTKLLPCQLQSERLEHLEYMHPIVRRWLNFAHAEKNDDGVLWRELLSQFDRNENMQYTMLPFWLCLHVERVE